MIPASAKVALEKVAALRGISVPSLAALIHFETAGKWDPAIGNPNSSARGLIQFTNATAQGLGYKDSADLVAKNPTITAQLMGPVNEYFKKAFASIPHNGTDQDLFMSVFYPAYRRKPAGALFPDNVIKANTYKAGGKVTSIRTPADYVAYVYGKAGSELKAPGWLLPAAGVVLVGVVFFSKGKK